MAIKERIEFSLDTILKPKGIEQAISSINRLNSTVTKSTAGAAKFTSITNAVNDSLIKQSRRFNVNTAFLKTHQKAYRRLHQGMEKGIKTSRRFAFEWLGIMFAGMAIDRVFGGLIRKQMDLFGVTETLSAAWTTVLLPIMDLLVPILYTLIDLFMNMSPEMQMVVGVFVLLAAIFGKAMFLIGQFVLGFTSLSMAFVKHIPAIGKVGSLWKWLGVLIKGISLSFILVAAIIIAVVVGMYLAWKSNFLGMKKTVADFIDGVKKIFSGVISIIKGILLVVKGLFTGDFELIKEGIIMIFKGLLTTLLGIWKAIGAGAIAILTGALKVAYNMVKAIVDGIMWAAGKVSKFFGGGGVAWRMPSFQYGGIVPTTGPILAHAGETILPAGVSPISYSPTININANVSSDMDIRRLAEELNRYLATGYSHVAKRRGVL